MTVEVIECPNFSYMLGDLEKRKILPERLSKSYDKPELIGRIFNEANIPSYLMEHINSLQPILQTLSYPDIGEKEFDELSAKQKAAWKKLESWIDQGLAIAYHELFNEKGEIHPWLRAKLNTFNRWYEHQISTANTQAVNLAILSTYYANVIAANATAAFKEYQLDVLKSDQGIDAIIYSKITNGLGAKNYKDLGDLISRDFITSEKIKYDLEKSKFQQAIQCEYAHNSLKSYARTLYQSIETVSKYSQADYHYFTEVMRCCNRALIHPEDTYNKEQLIQLTSHAATRAVNATDPRLLFAGALLCFVGAVLVVASIVAAVLSYGFSTPISVYGVKIGLAMMSAGLGCGLLTAAYSKKCIYDKGQEHYNFFNELRNFTNKVASIKTRPLDIINAETDDAITNLRNG